MMPEKPLPDHEQGLKRRWPSSFAVFGGFPLRGATHQYPVRRHFSSVFRYRAGFAPAPGAASYPRESRSGEMTTARFGSRP
jgi:hypothetical protein